MDCNNSATSTPVPHVEYLMKELLSSCLYLWLLIRRTQLRTPYNVRNYRHKANPISSSFTSNRADLSFTAFCCKADNSEWHQCFLFINQPRVLLYKILPPFKDKVSGIAIKSGRAKGCNTPQWDLNIHIFWDITPRRRYYQLN